MQSILCLKKIEFQQKLIILSFVADMFLTIKYLLYLKKFKRIEHDDDILKIKYIIISKYFF